MNTPREWVPQMTVRLWHRLSKVLRLAPLSAAEGNACLALLNLGGTAWTSSPQSEEVFVFGGR